MLFRGCVIPTSNRAGLKISYQMSILAGSAGVADRFKAACPANGPIEPTRVPNVRARMIWALSRAPPVSKRLGAIPVFSAKTARLLLCVACLALARPAPVHAAEGPVTEVLIRMDER